MLSLEQPKEASEHEAIKAILKFKEHLDSKNFGNLWVPTHLVHDAESDDSLSWLLLERMHRIIEEEQGKSSKLKVLIQLPSDPGKDKKTGQPIIDEVATFLSKEQAKRCDVQIFRDESSSNGKAVASTWSHYLPKKDAKKESKS